MNHATTFALRKSLTLSQCFIYVSWNFSHYLLPSFSSSLVLLISFSRCSLSSSLPLIHSLSPSSSFALNSTLILSYLSLSLSSPPPCPLYRMSLCSGSLSSLSSQVDLWPLYDWGQCLSPWRSTSPRGATPGNGHNVQVSHKHIHKNACTSLVMSEACKCDLCIFRQSSPTVSLTIFYSFRSFNTPTKPIFLLFTPFFVPLSLLFSVSLPPCLPVVQTGFFF